MKIAMTNFALRNWDKAKSGTLIEGLTPEEPRSLAPHDD